MTERSIEDRMGEALRICRYGLIRPLWADAPEDVKRVWRDASALLHRAMNHHGLKVVVEEGDGKHE